MKALQHLRNGGTLTVQTWPTRSIHLDAGVGSRQTAEGSRKETPWMIIHPTTAKILITMGWVELTKFNPRLGTYRLSAAGEKLTEGFCEAPREHAREFQNAHRHSSADEAAMLIDDRLVCRRCWRATPCAGKFFKELHAAQEWHWKYGPICMQHARRMAS